jgi:hypothetical protein
MTSSDIVKPDKDALKHALEVLVQMQEGRKLIYKGHEYELAATDNGAFTLVRIVNDYVWGIEDWASFSDIVNMLITGTIK